MPASALSKVARSLSRADFCHQIKSWYLVLEKGSIESDDLAFHTDLINLKEIEEEGGASRLKVDLHEIAKAPGNPYPDRISVGRARNCDIVLREASVSKLHAHFRPLSGGLEVVDLDSHNGTLVGGHRLPPRELVALQPGDTVQFGSVVGRVIDPGQLYDLLR